MEAEPLAGRYRFTGAHSLKGSTPTWLALDEKSGDRVIASALPIARVAALEGVVGLKHDRLAAIIELIHEPKSEQLPKEARTKKYGAVAVAEFVKGKSLAETLKGGALDPRQAVECAGAMAAAISTLQGVGGVHGAISPRNVVFKAVDRKGSVLVQLVSPASAAYCSPERIKGGGPSGEDDVWALHATLYAAVTGRGPFEGKNRDELLERMKEPPKRLSEYFLDDDELQGILDRGLDMDPEKRCTEVGELERAVSEWLRARSAPPSAPHFRRPRDPKSDRPVVPSILPSMPPTAPSLPPMPFPPDGKVPKTPSAPPDGKVPKTPSAPPSSPRSSPSSPPASPSEPVLPPSSPPSPLDLPRPPGLAAPPGFVADAGTDVSERISPSDVLRDAVADAQPASQPPSTPPGSTGAKAAVASAAPPSAPAPVPVAQKTGPGKLVIGLVVLILIGIGVASYLSSRKNVERSPELPTPTSESKSGSSKTVKKNSGPASTAESATGGDAGAKTEDSAAAESTDAGAVEQTDGGSAPTGTATTGAAMTLEEQGACVRSYFQEGTFKGDETFPFLCEDEDFRGIVSQIYRSVVTAGKGKITAGMTEWAQLGWYELGVGAFVRTGCCPASTPPPNLPKTGGPCQTMSEMLQAVATDQKKSPEELANDFGSTIRCYYSSGVARPYNYKKQPYTHETQIFKGFVERVHAKRAAKK